MKQQFVIPDHLVVKPGGIKKQEENENVDLKNIEEPEEETKEEKAQEPDFQRFE